mgnify:FL=1
MPGSRTLLVHPEDGSDRILSAFDAAGFDVTLVNNATSAIAKVTTGEYDCIVSEYALPGDDGLALAEAIEESDARVPVVLFSEVDDE